MYVEFICVMNLWVHVFLICSMKVQQGKVAEDQVYGILSPINTQVFLSSSPPLVLFHIFFSFRFQMYKIKYILFRKQIHWYPVNVM